MKIIPRAERRKCSCYFCGETRSVKYLVKIFDPVVDNKPCEVACCNKCALLYGGMENENYPNIIRTAASRRMKG